MGRKAQNDGALTPWVLCVPVSTHVACPWNFDTRLLITSSALCALACTSQAFRHILARSGVPVSPLTRARPGQGKPAQPGPTQPSPAEVKSHTTIAGGE